MKNNETEMERDIIKLYLRCFIKDDSVELRPSVVEFRHGRRGFGGPSLDNRLGAVQQNKTSP